MDKNNAADHIPGYIPDYIPKQSSDEGIDYSKYSPPQRAPIKKDPVLEKKAEMEEAKYSDELGFSRGKAIV